MARTKKRNIEIDGITYIWTMKEGNSLDVTQYLRVCREGYGNSILYINPYSWHFECRPKSIEGAIRFALSQGWNPMNNSEKMCMGMSSEGEWIEQNYRDNTPCK